MANASLAYEILLYLNSFYFGLFSICEVSMGLLKFIRISYTRCQTQIEITILVVFLFAEALRILFGRKGSLSEHGWQVIASVILTVPCSIGTVYLLFFQILVLQLERILCALLLCLQATELFYAFMFLFSKCRPQTYI